MGKKSHVLYSNQKNKQKKGVRGPILTPLCPYGLSDFSCKSCPITKANLQETNLYLLSQNESMYTFLIASETAIKR